MQEKYCTIQTSLGFLSMSTYGHSPHSIILFPNNNLYPGIEFDYSYHCPGGQLVPISEVDGIIHPYEIDELSRITREACKWQSYWSSIAD